MKINQFFLLMLIILTGSTLKARTSNPEFLFPDYEDAMVYFQNGQQSAERVNYNILTGKFQFIDKKDGLIKELSDTKVIRSFKVGNRNFVPLEGAIAEVLPTDPTIYVQYKAKAKAKGAQVGYGGTSEVSKSTSYSDYRQDGTYSKLKDLEMEVAGYYNYYWIEKNGKKKQFKDFKQFLKIYSSHKDVLNQYIKSNEVNFEDVEAIVNLCYYAESL